MRTSLVLLMLSACGGVKLDPKNPYLVARQETQVQLADGVSTTVALTFPDKGKGPHPTVVLVPSSGPMDMDHTLVGLRGPVPLFSDLADDLTSRGFAVLRYDKRHVQDFRQYDLRLFVADDTPRTQAEDLQTILTAMARDPRIDGDKLYLYGFGEGAQVAAEVAKTQSLAGLVLQAPPGMPYPERMTAWFEDLVVPHLESFGYRGVLNGMFLANAISEPVAPPVLECTEMLAVSYTRGHTSVKISPLVDLDRDGLLELEMELEPRIPDLVDLAFGPIGNLRQHAGDRALPTVDLAVSDLKMPLLILQGSNDATVSPENTDRIEAVLASSQHPDHEIARLEGLGHTLGVSRSALHDHPSPMAVSARETLLTWLVARAR